MREQETAAGASSSAAPENEAESKKQLDALVKQAQEALETSVADSAKQNAITPPTVSAALALAQLYLMHSQADKAIALLEDAKVGPLTLLQKNNPAAQATGIPAEIQKTALQAYVAVVPQQIDKATACMDALGQIYAQDPEGDAALTQLLVGIAYDLKQELQELDRRGDREKQTQLTKGVGQFLDRILQRSTAADFKTLNWVAATYESLAEGLKQQDKVTPEGKSLYAQAAKACEEILSRAAKDEAFLPADQAPAVKLRLAIAHRNAGDFDKALAALTDMLNEKPQLLPAQVEAARTFQQRGEEDNPDNFVLAIVGGTRRAKGVSPNIWGWGKIALQTSRNPRYRDTLHEASYNVAVCRMRYAQSRSDAAEKKKYFTVAKEGLRNVNQFDPTMGGDKWKPLYDKLLRSIQTELGQPAVGLQEFEQTKGTQAADTGKKES